ncbi:MAG: 1-deoxy-D-xylulose-5-phosphate reductoisomerase [Acetobacter sp.]|nr:1-deoxy-D-xylulose-5-phosphate reductoisomerase [Acetobacter sp.]
MRTVTVLGSTGSIGCSTVNLLEHARDQYRVRALVGGTNAVRLAEQALSLNVEIAVLADEKAVKELRDLLSGSKIQVACGRQAVIDAAALSVDWTMAAITGTAGLEPILAAVRNGGSIALANKEALVCAGDVMLRAVEEGGSTLLPVDSEHNAIFQAMQGQRFEDIVKIILTASGGPFRNATLDIMRSATPVQALKHPTWNMGSKISIDSATMFNKGLEIIEAARLFSLTEDRIDVLVHPQSIVHGLVQYSDGSLLAQMGTADMRIPIAHALAWPHRMVTTSSHLDLAVLSRLDFSNPDAFKFPALRLARQALREGGAAPAILSAANEIAVDAFLKEQIGFLDIARLVEDVMNVLGTPSADTLEAVLHWDKQARCVALEKVATFSL